MKRILALLLVLVMIFSFAACSNDNVRGKIKNETSSENELTDEKEFSLGVTSGNVYENKFIGIGCRLDDDWNFYTDEQIKQLNNVVNEAVGDELAAQLENADIIYDMYALHNGGMNSININLENVGLAYNATIDTKKYIENSMPSLKEGLSNMGYTDFNYEAITVDIKDKEFDGVKVTAEINGVKIYEVIFCIKCGKYLSNVAVATYNEDTTEQILECFYIAE